MPQPLKINLKVRWHCLRKFSKEHKIIVGWQHGYRLIFCECGYYKPRVNARGESIPANPFTSKMLTDPDVKLLIKNVHKKPWWIR